MSGKDTITQCLEFKINVKLYDATYILYYIYTG